MILPHDANPDRTEFSESTPRSEIILGGIAAGTVYAIVGTFLSVEVWTALAVVFVAAPLVFITAIVLAAKS